MCLSFWLYGGLTLSEIIATVMYILMTAMALIGFAVAASLFVGWLFSFRKGDMLSSYYDGFNEPSQTFPEGNYHPSIGYVPKP